MSVIVVVAVRLPLVPVTVTVLVPAVAVLDAVRVRVLFPAVAAGLKVAVTPAGSPLAASDTVPVKLFTGFTVTVLLPVAPCPMESVVGAALSLKLGWLLVTVRLIVAEWLRFPLVPVTVIFVVPTAAVLDAVKLNVLFAAVDAGLKLAVTPAGKPLAESATVPVNPFNGPTVKVLVAVPPCATETLVGFALKEKSGFVPVTVKAMMALWVKEPLVPTMEMLVVPEGVLFCPLKLIVTVPLPLTDDGLKLALTPVGRFAAETETVPVKPNSEEMVTWAVGFEPGVSVTAAGAFAVIEKSGRPMMVSKNVAV